MRSCQPARAKYHALSTELTVAVVTIFLHNLALAVFIGVVISALVFAWDNAKRIRARKFVDEQGVKHYEIYGSLFLDPLLLSMRSLV